MASDVPKHGDNIISTIKGNFGEPRMAATPQFQRFLDELGDLLDATTFDLSDAEQLIAVDDARIQALQAANNRLRQAVSDSIQLISVQESEIQTLQGNSRRMESRINDIEQLTHVN